MINIIKNSLTWFKINLIIMNLLKNPKKGGRPPREKTQLENKIFSLTPELEEKKRPEQGRERENKNPITGVKRRRTMTTSACGPDLERALQSLIESRLDQNLAVVRSISDGAPSSFSVNPTSPQPTSPPLSQEERQARERIRSLRPRPNNTAQPVNKRRRHQFFIIMFFK